MQATAYSEQKGSTDCQPQLNSVSCLLLDTRFGFWKIHNQAIKNCIYVKVGSQLPDKNIILMSCILNILLHVYL